MFMKYHFKRGCNYFAVSYITSLYFQLSLSIRVWGVLPFVFRHKLIIKKRARLPDYQQTRRRRPGAALGSVGLGQWPYQVQLLALLVGVDRCSLVVVH